MDKALIFKDDEERIVTADEVLKNFDDYKDVEFVDPEEEFRVNFIKDCKGHYGPYFRFYLSKEDYKKLTPERKTRYDILADQRHFQEGPWHRYWEEKFSPHGEIEYYVRSTENKKYKRSDFFYPKGKTCVEFQHSYIANDFEERNDFYSKEGLNIVWLYDLSKMAVKERNDGYFEILENNAKGFFRIAENKKNLEEYPVFIQVKGGIIYRVKELLRKDIDNDLKSTIRLFKPFGTYSEDEFVKAVLNCDDNLKSEHFKSTELSSIYDLWNRSYSVMIVTDGEKEIKITGTKDGGMFRKLDSGAIRFSYVDWYWKSKTFKERNVTDYPMSKAEANSKKWKLLKSYFRKE